MSLQQNINKYWDYLEQKYPCPKYVGKVKCMEFKDLKKAVDNYKGDLKQLVILLSDIGGIINPDIEKIANFCKEKSRN